MCFRMSFLVMIPSSLLLPEGDTDKEFSGAEELARRWFHRLPAWARRPDRINAVAFQDLRGFCSPAANAAPQRDEALTWFCSQR